MLEMTAAAAAAAVAAAALSLMILTRVAPGLRRPLDRLVGWEEREVDGDLLYRWMILKMPDIDAKAGRSAAEK